MITVTLTFKRIVTTHNFSTLTDALKFARSKEVGTVFQIREEDILLAKGKIESLKEFNYE
jgi:hypothetical protein